MQLRRAVVRVPCSTSNLGSGFDTIGLALDRYLTATFEPDEGAGLRLEREGALAALSDDDGPDLVAEHFSAELGREGVDPVGVLHLTSTIPIGRGLGSSAAAVLAAFDLARAVRGEPRSDEDAFEAVMRLEGHGDNAAPCLYGGLRAVAGPVDDPVVMHLRLSKEVGFAYAAPATRLSTDAARKALPQQVTHKAATASLGRLAALIEGLADGRPDLIRIGVRDELHVPHRLPMIHRATEAMRAADDTGAWGVTISGAGSGLIAICAVDAAGAVAAAMRAVFADGSDDPECVGFAVRPDHEGLKRLTS